MTTSETKTKFSWVSIVRAIIQAAIAALTALGVTSCSPIIAACML